MLLKGKCALITGSTAGLGYSVAECLAKAGATVILHGLVAGNEGVEAADRIAEEHGVPTTFYGTDLTDSKAIADMSTAIVKEFGGIDVLVNNAVLRHFSPTEDFKPEDWDASIAVNLSAAFHLVRLSLPGMKQKNWGRIVNMSSIYGSRGAENRVDYVTTKTALLGLTRALAVELAQTGITCNAVSPGTVPSPAIVDKIGRIAEEEEITREQAEAKYLASRNPTGRFVDPHGVGALVSFLCTTQAQDITGATLPIDGGWAAS